LSVFPVIVYQNESPQFLNLSLHTVFFCGKVAGFYQN